MKLGEPDESGRRRPIPIEGSETILDVECVIVAIGNGPNPLVPSTTPGLETNRRGNIVADEETGLTSKKGVFAGGDIVTGAATVILAMGAGKKAAVAIDNYVMGRELKPEPEPEPEPVKNES
jgi:glutamate synthase (NADPH/NADH) small chain